MNRASVEIDYETVDRITVCGLTDYRDSLQQQLDRFKAGGWLHADDVAHSIRMIEAIDFVLNDFVQIQL